MGQSPIELPGTLESFFYDRVLDVQRELGERVSRAVEAYVVYLLAAYARRTDCAGRKTTSLCLDYLAARDAGPVALRKVGDRAMCLAGLAPRSLERTPVDVTYVQSIGASAYRDVHVLASRLTVFADLAEHFSDACLIVHRAGTTESEADLLAQYLIH
jgi:hypothetical protein